MAIPERPLNFRPADLTIDDMIALDGLQGNIQAAQMPLLKSILMDASDWSEAEIGKIRIRELAEVMQLMTQARRAEEDAAVPPATGDSSPAGLSTVRAASPAGSSL